MIELNYKEKLYQIEKELKQWSNRILTPLGRINILKTLIISKLNRLFISLPNPSDELINTLQKQFFFSVLIGGLVQTELKEKYECKIIQKVA